MCVKEIPKSTNNFANLNIAGHLELVKHIQLEKTQVLSIARFENTEFSETPKSQEQWAVF